MGLSRTRLTIKNLKTMELCHMTVDMDSILRNIQDAVKDNIFEKNNVTFQISVSRLASTSFVLSVGAFDSENYHILENREIHERFGSEAALKSFLVDSIERFISDLNDANITFKYLEASTNKSLYRVENGMLYAPVYSFKDNKKLDVDFEMKDFPVQFDIPDIDKIVGGLLYERD